jgi:hypothetical protein
LADKCNILHDLSLGSGLRKKPTDSHLSSIH